MKKLYFIIPAILAIHFSFATHITLTSANGIWNTASSWNLNRRPQSGDTIMIPASKTVTVDDQQSLNNVYLKVNGTIRFANFLSFLNLDNASSVYVFTGGKIEATINAWQYIFIGGHTVFYQNQIVGPQMANSSSGNGFIAFNPLPVKFVGFSVAKKNNDALIQWSTSEELNADRYEIERSVDGTNWNAIAQIKAIGNSQNLNNYSYTDKNVTAKILYYRVKQVDQDANFVYTAVRSIRTDADGASNIKIAATNSQIILQFPSEIKGTVLVRLISLSGQVIGEQQLTNPFGQIVLPAKTKGYQVVSLSSADMHVVRQIVL